MKRSIGYVLFWISLAVSQSVYATKTNGRFEAGGLIATERFADDATGSNKNDFENFTFRSYLDVSEIGSPQFDFKWDIRDKYDLFDKLNKERLQLDPANSLQVHQLNASKPIVGSSGVGLAIGRLPISEAGGAFTDGVEFTGKYDDWNGGLFAGLNPKIAGQTHFEFNPDAKSGGGYLTYRQRSTRWDRAFSLTHAYVTQTVKSDVDRQYLFHNMSYQWEQDSRLITLAYLDFVPRTYVQMGSAYYQQSFSRKFYTKLSLLGVDVIQYLHIQDVREKLDPSPYRQGNLKLDYRVSSLSTLELGALYGKRSVDQLEKKEYALSLLSLKTFGPKWDTQVSAGYRNNFVSRDQFARGNIGYYTPLWETNLDVEYTIEKYVRTQVTKHAVITELSLAHFFARDLFATLSLQRAADEEVKIMTAFFKIGYRFGSSEIAPLRNESPVRGTL